MAEDCQKCSKALTDSDLIVSCSDCASSFCPGCLLPGIMEFSSVATQKMVLKFIKVESSITVNCDACADKPPENTDERVGRLEQRIDKMADEVSAGFRNLADFIGSGVTSSKNPESGPGSSGKNYSSKAAKNSATKSGFLQVIKSSVSAVFSEENHKRQIVITGLPEPKKAKKEGKKTLSITDQDIATVSQLLTDLGLPGMEPVISRMDRGKGVPDKFPRKVKLELFSHGQQQQILNAKGKLATIEKWNGTFLRESKPWNERKDEIKLRKQVSELNRQANGDNFWENWEEATVKYGLREIKGKLQVVKFSREEKENWPKKGDIVAMDSLPLVDLNWLTTDH